MAITLTFFLALNIVLTFIYCDGGGNWGYKTGQSFDSPSQWKSLPQTSCGGTRQSPINIVPKAAQTWSGLQPLTLTQGQASGNVLLKTSATSFYIYFSNSWTLSFSGVGCFRPVALHWHWGSVDTQGSEHTVDGTQYSMEGHLVTYNCYLYGNAADATIYPSGLHVFAILYKVGDTNAAMDKFMPSFSSVLQNGNASVPEISPMEFLPKNLGSYYRYEGSLTTPPCTENVLWTVFTEIQTLSSSQLASFRTLKFSSPEIGPMVDNFRPTNPLTPSSDYISRVVYFSFGARSLPISPIGYILITMIMLAIRGEMMNH